MNVIQKKNFLKMLMKGFIEPKIQAKTEFAHQ
jgi:hypothetical protein